MNYNRTSLVKAQHLILLFLIHFSFASVAKVKVEAHFNFGKTGNVTYAPAPGAVYSDDSKIKLEIQGNPVFNAEAPFGKALNGNGCLLFNGKGDGYSVARSIGNPSDRMVFEVWVKARTFTHGETRGRNIDAIRPVVSDGTPGDGYAIAQRGKQWVLTAGRSRFVVIGDVILNQWVHLAAVSDGTNGTVWKNGIKVNNFTPATSYAANFAIAGSPPGNPGASFNGDIYEARYSTFQPEEFDPKSDFLLYYEQAKANREARHAERARLVTLLEKEGFGKELVTALPNNSCEKDWLITTVDTPCKLIVEKSKDNISANFRLDNGLVSRTFFMAENLACVGCKNLKDDAEYLRAIKPEARIKLDGAWYEIGGLKGQPENAYLLKDWYPRLENSDLAFSLANVETSRPIKRYDWAPRHHALSAEWPPKGLQVTMSYKPPETAALPRNLLVKVHYEIYQGIPVMAKWLEVINDSEVKVIINNFEAEVLAVNQDQVKRIHVESDYSFADVNKDPKGSILHPSYTITATSRSSDPSDDQYVMPSSTTLWTVDPDYSTWATQNPAEDKFLDYPHRNLLLSRLPAGPAVYVVNQHPFTSYMTFELLQDSDDTERRSLGVRHMYKTLAPQVTESLLSVDLPSRDTDSIKAMLDQMASLKMERLETMRSGAVAHNNLNESYIAHWKELAAYAKERGIVLGAYELQITSKGRGADVDCVPPSSTGQPASSAGKSVCIASKWKDTYFSNMWSFYDLTGFKSYNVDGPFHGRLCASTLHKYHRGLEDSQWEQWKTQVEVLHELCKRGIRIQIPDWYFLNGCASTGMGYREGAANLTPQQQLLLGRQYIYDGTWYKLPTMGWMNLDLAGPYAKDPKVGLLPLNRHLDRYRQALMQYLASGCQFGILGLEIYDSAETEAMVSECFDWFREYRDILTSEIIHVSRPSGRDLDCFLHVNPNLRRKGLLVIFNPTDSDIEKVVKVPLYYTGLNGLATISHEGKDSASLALNDKTEVALAVRVKAQGLTWYVVE